MAFIKEESEDVKIEETLGVKLEDSDDDGIGLFSFSKLNSLMCPALHK